MSKHALPLPWRSKWLRVLRREDQKYRVFSPSPSAKYNIKILRDKKWKRHYLLWTRRQPQPEPQSMENGCQVQWSWDQTMETLGQSVCGGSLKGVRVLLEGVGLPRTGVSECRDASHAETVSSSCCLRKSPENYPGQRQLEVKGSLIQQNDPITRPWFLD